MDSEPRVGGQWAVFPVFVVAVLVHLVTHGLALFVIGPAALVGLRLGRGAWWWGSLGALLAALGFVPWLWRLRG